MELILVITFVALAALAFYYTRKKPASTVATPSTVEEAPAPVVEEAPAPVVEEAPAKKPRKPRAPKAAPAPVVAEKPVKATRKPRVAKAEPAPAPAKKPRAPRSKKV